MLIKEIIQRRLTISNPTTFCENKVQNVLTTLNHQYKHHCFNDGWIERITDENLSIGEVEINLSDNEFKGTMDVRFTIEKDVMNRGTTLLAKVIEIKRDLIFLMADRANIIVPLTYTHEGRTIDLSAFRPDNIIPIQVLNRTMSIAAPRANVDGRIFIPTAISYVFVVSGEISPSLDMNRLIQRSNELQAEIKAIEGDKHYKFFKDFIYPYKTDKTGDIDKTRKETIVNIARGAVNLKNKKLIKDSRIHWAVDNSVVVQPVDGLNPPDFTGAILEIPLQKIIVKLLSDQINMAELLLAMVRTYNTDELIKTHNVVWNLK